MLPLLKWLQDRRRQKILEKDFPPSWETITKKNLAHRPWLNEAEHVLLRELVQVFVAEKNFEGAGGLRLTNEIRLTIATDACILVLGLPHDLYRKVQSIVVYPSTVIAPPRQIGVFEAPSMPVRGGVPILGQAHLRGPVILSWDAVKQSPRHPQRSHNVVIHEFAHKLDMLDGSADGTPPLDEREDYKRWADVCTASFKALQERSEQGKKTTLDSYGGVNEAEFFAVATESFFENPVKLRRFEPALYDLLSGFYHQDPASRLDP